MTPSDPSQSKSEIAEEYIFERLQACVSETLGTEMSAVESNTRLQHDLKADGLDVVEFVMRVEEEFGFAIEDEDYDKFVWEDAPVSEMENFIRGRLA